LISKQKYKKEICHSVTQFYLIVSLPRLKVDGILIDDTDATEIIRKTIKTPIFTRDEYGKDN